MIGTHAKQWFNYVPIWKNETTSLPLSSAP